MGFLDKLLGRSRPVPPDLDRLFALPAAAITLQAATGFVPTGAASVCFAGVEGGAFRRVKEEVRDLLDASSPAGPDPQPDPAEYSEDPYGYTWLLLRRPAEDTVTLVNDLHAVNTLLEDAGFGPHLLCSLMTFRTEARQALALVYLYKRGTFYPFAPEPGAGERRDNALELEVRGVLAEDLRMEGELDRWFPVWGAPGLEG
ncbi:PspA-associated protein PspAB [Streptomyces sp. NPDC003691]